MVLCSARRGELLATQEDGLLYAAIRRRQQKPCYLMMTNSILQYILLRSNKLMLTIYIRTSVDASPRFSLDLWGGKGV